jgi:hypothetical protein
MTKVLEVYIRCCSQKEVWRGARQSLSQCYVIVRALGGLCTHSARWRGSMACTKMSGNEPVDVHRPVPTA